jgi:hypothetical protein
METKEGYKELIDKFEYYQAKTIDSKYGFFKNISTLCLGFLALFVNFKPNSFSNEWDKMFFLFTTALFGLCILFSLVSTRGEVFLYHQSSLARAKMLLKYMTPRSVNAFQNESTEVKKVYIFFEKMTYVCLILSIVSLIVYVYFSLY